MSTVIFILLFHSFCTDCYIYELPSRLYVVNNEPRCEKTGFFAYAKTRTQISFAVTAKLISALVFATRKVHSVAMGEFPKWLTSRNLRKFK